MTSLSPLCPPAPPARFSRTVPTGRSSSSWTTSTCSEGTCRYSQKARTDWPLRFM